MKGLSELWVLEEPFADVNYYMGTDPIPFGDKAEASLESEERSNQVSIILRDNPENPNAPYPVALYKARTNEVGMVYSETAYLQKQYNNCKNNLERNAGSAFMQEYDRDGTQSLLARYPWTALVTDYKNKKIAREKLKLRGWNNDNSTRGPAVALLAKWIPNAISYTWSKDIIEGIEKLGLENSDEGWALISALILWRHMQNISSRSNDKTEYKEVITSVYEMTPYGPKYVRKRIKIPILGGHEGIVR